MCERDDATTPPLLPVLRLPEGCGANGLVSMVPTPRSCPEDGDVAGLTARD